MPAIQAHFAPVKNPAPSVRPSIPNMMTMYASSTGPVPIPARREAPPKRESKPPAAATIAIIGTPTGLLGFGAEDCIISRFQVYMISLLDRLTTWAISKTTGPPRTPVSPGQLLLTILARGFSGVVEPGCTSLGEC